MLPKDCRFTKDHEWIRQDGDVYTVGITAFAAEQLGDVTYVELPETGAGADAHGELATVESVKAASDVYAPVAGTVAEVNSALEEKPELVNESPFGDGWFFKLSDVDVSQYESLMDADAYDNFLGEHAE
jgi:glycine cleavage system H protein